MNGVRLLSYWVQVGCICMPHGTYWPSFPMAPVSSLNMPLAKILKMIILCYSCWSSCPSTSFQRAWNVLCLGNISPKISSVMLHALLFSYRRCAFFALKLKPAMMLTRRVALQTTLSVSNVPGPTEPVMFSGNPIVSIYPTGVGHPAVRIQLNNVIYAWQHDASR